MGSGAAGTTGHRSLADQLRSWTDEQVSELLTSRPDLTTPAPHDFSQLASRAAIRSSLARALDSLTRGELSVLDALVVAGQTTDAEIVGIVRAEEEYVVAAVARLRSLALAWDSPEGLRPLTGVADCLVGGPEAGVSGLRPRTANAPGADVVAARIGEVSEAARAMLDHVLAHGGEATTGSARRNVRPEDASGPAEELLSNGLLVPGKDDLLVVPGEVVLALRGGRTTTEPVDRAPEVATAERPVHLTESAAAGAAGEFCRRTELLLEWWSTRPAAALRTGGLGVRELKATALHLHQSEPDTALVIEAAAGAGLIATRADADGNPVWVPTDAFDSWLDADIAERWTTLARAWLASTRLPGLVGGRAGDDKPWNALTPELSSVLMPETRAMTLAALAEVPPGRALASGTGLPSLVARLAWQRPRRSRSRADQVAWTVTEAAVLGVTGLDALSPYGRALIAGDDPAPLLAERLPAPVDHVLIQADLTAVAPGPVESGIARSLQLLADVESRGAATVYRFTAPSVRRALDAGWTAAEVHAFLASVSRTPVPQPLTFLVDDAVRTFGQVRVGYAESFVRSDDEATLAALARHPKAASLGLRLLAPTVLVSTTPVDLLLVRLRELGVSPVVEGPDGTLRVGRPAEVRARTPRQRGPAHSEARHAAQVAAAVRSLRAGDAAARVRPAAAVSPAGALSALRDAIERHASVVIAFTDNQGVVGERVVEPLSVEGGRLTAHDRTADDVRTFAVHRISRVTPVP
ncbi:helicase-associated domain-containing protein [Nocardioides bizhenqiangii]|uniref:Helicase-associated domain-containing protein n=1 Tax=Nocardioides bizhenqiangii TaxID=3095076 RepID=A0ABZ0ZQT3_9ACTN|nr:helicase-associated domain-containing protein [Nocardioides sp. HM61]WQQ25838.1 helicase-associated domain-containing protein [Nocardioides sp. HM61]